ncbi:MAG TPA: ABC transporter permease [Gemmatimonadaceae bacterium]|nr:ABC transporter permease [Gemmatimonadaceae bacterium]
MKPRLGARLRALLWRVPPDQAVDEELAFHIEMRARRNREIGMDPAGARRAAIRRFGNLASVRDECRAFAHRIEDDMKRAELLQELRQDAGYALRMLRKSPLFTAMAIATLAIGIGASTAIFSVVNAVLLRGLPYRNASQLVLFWNGYASSGQHTSIAAAEFADIREQQQSFDGVAAVSYSSRNLTGGCTAGSGACEPQRVSGYTVSPELFELLGVAPAMGRGFSKSDGAEGAPRVAILSASLWHGRFGGDSALVGKSIAVDGVPRTVVGILPAEVRFPDAPLGFLRERGELYVPYSWEQFRTDGRGNQFLGVVARLRPGATLARARADADAIAARFRRDFPRRYVDNSPGWSLDVVPLRDEAFGDVRPALFVLLGAVGFVLLIACANVANLLLARAASRRRELAVRTALGAGRFRLIRQLLTESAILALAGGGFGVMLAFAGVPALARLDPGSVPLLDGARVDGVVLAFSLGVSVLTGMLFGLIPAIRQSRLSVQSALRSDGRSAGVDRPRRRFRSALVVAEVAMALVVLIGAGLLLRSFVALQHVRTGFDAGPSLSFQISPPRSKYDSIAKVAAFHTQLVERLGSMPGVEAATAVWPMPMSGDGWSGSFSLEGAPPDGKPEHAEYAVTIPGYFHVMRIPLMAGREFSREDAAGAPPAVIVDEALARHYWPGESALGKRLGVMGINALSTIVGVVGHVRNAGPQREGEWQVYVPFAQHPQRPLAYVVRARGSGAGLADAIRTQVRTIDPDMPLAKLQSTGAIVARGLARERFNLLLLAIFAAASLLLAATGLYGVMAYLVTQRVQEIGIRLALGGRPDDVLRLVVGEGLAMTLAGLLLGLVGAALLSRAMTRLLYGVAAVDPITYGAIALLLCLIALGASYIPARRATRIDPAVALRG